MENFMNLENSNSTITYNLTEQDEDEIISNIYSKLEFNKYNFINEIVNDLINDSIYNSGELTDTLKERVKIYEKFGIKIKNVKEIDLVYTYINYNDKKYIRQRESFELFDLDNRLLDYFKDEDKESYHDFLMNIEITRKNLPFIRRIYIITPNSEFIFENEKYIIIPIEEIYGKDKFAKIYFRPNNIVKYLTEIKGLSNIFFFGYQDCLAIKNLRKEYFFRDNIPIIYLQKKMHVKEENIKSIEDNNTIALFQKKFDSNLKLSTINHITLVRKDCINFTKKIFSSNTNINFLLLQYLVGYNFGLYNVKLSTNYNGFYRNNEKNMYEKMNLLKNKKVDFFCINYLNKTYIRYYIQACLVNLAIIDTKVIKNIIFISEKENRKIRYVLPGIERSIQKATSTELNFDYITSDIIEDYHKFGEVLYLSFGVNEKKIGYLNHIAMEMNDIININDILFFLNIGGNYSIGERMKVYYPPKVMRRLDEEFGIPFTKMLGISSVDFGVKIAKISFNEKLI